MELAAQPICLLICMNTYFFCSSCFIHLQTGNVNRSAISRWSFPCLSSGNSLNSELKHPPLCLRNSKLRFPPPPHLQNSSRRTPPPPPSEFQDATRGMCMVWIFSGITHCTFLALKGLNAGLSSMARYMYHTQGFRDYAFFFSANYALFFAELCAQNPELCTNYAQYF